MRKIKNKPYIRIVILKNKVVTCINKCQFPYIFYVHKIKRNARTYLSGPPFALTD